MRALAEALLCATGEAAGALDFDLFSTAI